MPEMPASDTSSLPQDRLQDRQPWFRRQASALLGSGSVEDKAVRFGSLEPAHVTLAKQCLQPLIVVLMLAICTLAADQALSMSSCALALVAFLIAARIFRPLDLQSPKSAERTRRAISRILIEWGCVVAVLAFLSTSFNLTHLFSRDIMVSWFLCTPFALLLTDSLCVPIAKRLSSERVAIERYIIIGANDVGFELARRLDQNASSGKFCGFFDSRGPGRLAKGHGKPVVGNCSAADLANIVRNDSISRVYLALPISTAPRVQELLRELRDTTASIYFVPNIFAFDLVQARCVEINGMPAFSICDSPLQGMSGLWKRALDITLASLTLLLTWPVLLTVALAIKQTSPGPVLFKQRRYGLNGEEILVYKFRSMTVCEDGPALEQATEYDRRVTPLGAFLRRTSLDELPQILNVLEGKMSFVGPRPHAVAHNEAYRKLISGYMIRHKVRPGITGWAQVNGLRGATPSVEMMRRRVDHDVWYAQNASLALDLKIMLRTPRELFRQRNAY